MDTAQPGEGAAAITGRPRITNQDAIQRAAMGLFNSRGFDSVTMTEIAEAAGVSRRTLFRYFATKPDIVWGDFGRELARMRTLLDTYAQTLSVREALRRAFVDFNIVPDEAVELHRQRMEMIMEVPGLQAHSTLKYAQWRHEIEEFLHRQGVGRDAPWYPGLIGHLCLAASLSAYERWLHGSTADLHTLLNESYTAMVAGLNEQLHLVPGRPFHSTRLHLQVGTPR